MMASEPKSSAAQSVISLKVRLRGIRPPVWRRLLMPGAMTLADLHEAIQMAIGWEGGHLHLFDIDGRHYGDRRTVDDVADENRLSLNAISKSGVTRFAYTYDFGDDWEHSVAIERTLQPTAGQPYPACVAGKRNCPPEDCGGVRGYQDLLEILADPAHPEHTERLEWLGEGFDPDDFSVAIADASLAARFKRK